MRVKYDELPEFHRWILAQASMRKLEQALGDNTDPYMDVTIQINGVELEINFVDCLSEMELQLNRMVEEQAKIIVQNKYSELINKLQDMSDSLDKN